MLVVANVGVKTGKMGMDVAAPEDATAENPLEMPVRHEQVPVIGFDLMLADGISKMDFAVTVETAERLHELLGEALSKGASKLIISSPLHQTG